MRASDPTKGHPRGEPLLKAVSVLTTSGQSTTISGASEACECRVYTYRGVNAVDAGVHGCVKSLCCAVVLADI